MVAARHWYFNNIINDMAEQTNKGQAPKQSVPPQEANSNLITREEAMEMAKQAAKDAVAAITQQQQAPTQVVVQAPSNPKEKPNTERSNAGIPDEDFLPEDFRVFHLGFSYSFDQFIMADGRIVEPPRSKIIVFSNYAAGASERFGRADAIPAVCAYRTRDRREKDLFQKDVRWRTEFWEQNELGVRSEDIEGQQLMNSWSMKIANLPFRDLHSMCLERGINISDVAFMRTELAMYESRREMMERKALRSASEVEAQKEKLLSK